jgi:hypothetical protein
VRAMNASAPRSSSPYASWPAGPGGHDALPWYRVLVRVVLVVVPGQVVGAILATLVVAVVDITARPGASALFWVLPGLLAGVALGLLLSPRGPVPWRHVGLGAAVGAVAILLLVGLGRSRVASASFFTPALLGGLVGCVAIQTVAALGLRTLRARRARGRR